MHINLSGNEKVLQKTKVDMSVYIDLNKKIEKEAPLSPKEEETDENQLNSKEVVMPALLIFFLTASDAGDYLRVFY